MNFWNVADESAPTYAVAAANGSCSFCSTSGCRMSSIAVSAACSTLSPCITLSTFMKPYRSDSPCDLFLSWSRLGPASCADVSMSFRSSWRKFLRRYTLFCRPSSDSALAISSSSAVSVIPTSVSAGSFGKASAMSITPERSSSTPSSPYRSHTHSHAACIAGVHVVCSSDIDASSRTWSYCRTARTHTRSATATTCSSSGGLDSTKRRSRLEAALGTLSFSKCISRRGRALVDRMRRACPEVKSGFTSSSTHTASTAARSSGVGVVVVRTSSSSSPLRALTAFAAAVTASAASCSCACASADGSGSRINSTSSELSAVLSDASWPASSLIFFSIGFSLSSSCLSRPRSFSTISRSLANSASCFSLASLAASQSRPISMSCAPSRVIVLPSWSIRITWFDSSSSSKSCRSRCRRCACANGIASHDCSRNDLEKSSWFRLELT
mmetsp:Transcript_30856/g.90561  ORF Transcript_30856/g.90561 Transcript_30856/m.90561 type:complete len:442 (-) Transcript_30856:666-1991(-)